jgi:competence protein ComEA
MQTPKFFIFNKYYFTVNLLLLIILCLFAGCNGQNRAKQVLSNQNEFIVSKSAININTASSEELQKIPNIGAKLAEKIIKHREQFGKFRKPENLILVPGISDKRFRKMRGLIKVE